MAPGVTLAVIGAILAFAVRAELSGIDLRIVGLILMLAGAGLIWPPPGHHARAGRDAGPGPVEDLHGPASPITENQVVRETIQERDHE